MTSLCLQMNPPPNSVMLELGLQHNGQRRGGKKLSPQKGWVFLGVRSFSFFNIIYQLLRTLYTARHCRSPCNPSIGNPGREDCCPSAAHLRKVWTTQGDPVSSLSKWYISYQILMVTCCWPWPAFSLYFICQGPIRHLHFSSILFV